MHLTQPGIILYTLGPHSNAPTLSLWDCASQRGFVESYLSEDGQATVFAHASTMIYVFDVTRLVNGRPPEMSLDYFSRCLEALDRQSPGAPVFVLIQKMDLVQSVQRQADFDTWVNGVKAAAGSRSLIAYGTSIYEDTLYRVRLKDPYLSLDHESSLYIGGLVRHHSHSRPQCERSHPQLEYPVKELRRS